MSHTPGPWAPISVTGGWDGVAEDANRNSIICNLSLNNPDNMYLIAAAPELLKALKESFQAVDNAYDLALADIAGHDNKLKRLDNLIEQWKKQAKAAIAKAEGK